MSPIRSKDSLLATEITAAICPKVFWRLIPLLMICYRASYLNPITFWMPALIHGTGNSGNTRIGWLSAIPLLCAIASMNLCGRSADRHRERRWHVIVPALAGAMGFIVAAAFAQNRAESSSHSRLRLLGSSHARHCSARCPRRF